MEPEWPKALTPAPDGASRPGPSDLGLVMGYWGGGASRTYHHTAPVNSILGLAESLELLKEEGLENA